MKKTMKKPVRGSLRRFLSACLVWSMMLSAGAPLEVHADETGKTEYSVLQEEDFEWIAMAREALQEIVQERDIMALVYLCDSYDVRESAGTKSAVLSNAYSGQTVNILDMEIAEEDEEIAAWAKVSFYENGEECQGYIERTHLACSDERFLNWEDEYGMKPAAHSLYAAGDGTPDYSDVLQFPVSYQAALTELKNRHPSWVFVPFNTGLDWQTVINNEMGSKSLVYRTFPDYTKEGAYDGGNWYYASESILKYYMDPRNALTDDAVFQFEQLTYNESYHIESIVENFLAGSFMRSPEFAPGTDNTYAHIFWETGVVLGVSPFHLAARVYQEQGSNGGSKLISGDYPEYENCYNYFNINASGRTEQEVIINGLRYAQEQNWNNAKASILGGANVISANYIRKGQDTLYLEKYNVNPYGQYALYTHQYMQNISAPSSESKSIKKLYDSANSLENVFVFKIPVYINMPINPCAYPTASDHNGGESTVTDYSLVFDAGYYYRIYSDLAAAFGNDENLLFQHFLNSGMAEGRVASAEFDINIYKANYPDLVAAFGEDNKSYYLHYIGGGKAEGRTASEVIGNVGTPSVAQGLSMEECAPVFNAEYYYNTYSDLAAAFGNDAEALFAHFVSGGMAEGRVASAEFDINVYKVNYPDLVAAFGEDNKSYYLHYIGGGKAEGRIASDL